LTAGGELVNVPLHRHDITIDLSRVELEARYGVTDRWQAALRMPYERKDQSVTINTIDAATPEEVAAMQRNGDIHHRDETYTGFSDFSLLAQTAFSGLVRERDGLRIGFGATIPVGRTEDDPWKLGEAGDEHLHIQFGTGTFDPIAEVIYSTAVGAGVTANSFVSTRLPVYENDKTYRGSREITAMAGLSRALGPVGLRANYLFFRQGASAWDGERDKNSGLVSHGVMLGASYKLGRTALGVDVRIPVSQRLLADEEDAFEQGVGVMVRLGI
ncbi:MAG: hypothetical protein HKN20_13120, partial [Gemmatimonadetes bacterium]|nr:hypothetical protein [Gemmatimonadota bacterium]